jgi:DNA-binding transcriptional LysR family regulator
MESYHGIVACVTAGAGLALIPASMLDSMPGKSGVKIYPLGNEMGKIKIWLMWRKGSASANQKAMVTLLEAMN